MIDAAWAGRQFIATSSDDHQGTGEALHAMTRGGKIIRWLLGTVSVLGAVYFMFYGYIHPVLAGYPRTVDAAADEALGWMSPAQRATMRATRRDDLFQYHLGLGMAIRNEFGLWDSNWLLLQSACDTPCHPDHASGVIIGRMWEKLQQGPDRTHGRPDP